MKEEGLIVLAHEAEFASFAVILFMIWADGNIHEKDSNIFSSRRKRVTIGRAEFLPNICEEVARCG